MRLEGQAVHAVSSRLRAMNERITNLSRGTSLESVPPGGMLERRRSWLGWNRVGTSLPAPDPREVLKQSRVFSGLPRNTLHAFADAMEIVPFADGDIVLEQASFGRDAWIVASGRVGVYRAVRSEHDEKIADLMPGDVFGLVGLVYGSSRTATCICEEPTWLLHLPEKLYSDFTAPTADGAPYLHRAIYEAQADQLDRANQRVAQLIVALMGEGELGDEERAVYHEIITHTL